MRVDVSLGGKTLSCLKQYCPTQYTVSSDGKNIKTIVDKTTKDGTGVTPDKRRNELSFRDGAKYNYSFTLHIDGSQKNAIANLWQMKTKGEKYPRLSLGVKRVGDSTKLAYKVGSKDSAIIGDAGVHKVQVKCKTGELFVDGKKITTFDSKHSDDTITKFGIEADKEYVDSVITVMFKDISLTTF
jgi:hypothetical protein